MNEKHGLSVLNCPLNLQPLEGVPLSAVQLQPGRHGYGLPLV